MENTENSGLYREGMAVMHKRFGRGKILSIDNTGNSYAVIEFATGKMTLALNYAPLQIVD